MFKRLLLCLLLLLPSNLAHAAFGAVTDAATASATSIPAAFSPTTAVTVAVGDLVVVWVTQQTNLTCTGVTDNLSNTYTAINAGTDDGSITAIGFYSYVTAAGESTPVAACTSSTNNASIIVVSYEGPFNATPLDANPANTTDATSPFTTAETGTLAQADELVVGFFASSVSATAFSDPTPDGTILVASASGAVAAIVVAATTSITISITQANTTNTVQTIASFMAEAAAADTSVPSGIIIFQ